MNNLNINYRKLNNYIQLKTDYWVNIESTNCYAFALGLDIPEFVIMKNAYNVGVIGFTKEHRSLSSLRTFSYEDRFIKDLKALNLMFEEASIYDSVKDGNKYSYFLVSMFDNGRDFHFFKKKKKDGTWWHKRGWYCAPTNLDDDLEVITDLKEPKVGSYKHIKTYKIGFKRR